MECCGRWQTDRQTDIIRQMNYSGIHRGKPSGREQRSKPHSWSRGLLLPVEHIGDFRTEGESQERLVSDESEEEVRVLGKVRVKS